MPKKNVFKLDVVSVRLVKDAPLYADTPIDNPQKAVELLGDYMCQLDREVVCVLSLKSNNVPINAHFASMGSVNAAMAHPRELMKACMLSNAANMMIIHCHPSGKLEPSEEDTMLTDRMNNICAWIGIPLLDHIIVGGDNREYFSFREKRLIPSPSMKLKRDYNELNIGAPMVAEHTKGR